MRARALFLATACAVGLGLQVGSAGAAPVAFSVAERGSLGRLRCNETSGPIEFEAARGNSVARGRGPDAQYVLEMGVRVEPLNSQGAGSMSIHGEVGGEPGASVSVERAREGGQWLMRWSSIDLVDGSRTGTVATSGSGFETSNYLPFGTVRPGRNWLRFHVECFGEAPIAAVEVLGSTALRETEQWPARLRLTALDAVDDPEAGAALPVGFEIANTGDLPALDVEVSLIADKARARVVGRTSYVYSELSGEQSGEFLVIPRRPGPLHAELVATSGNSNQPAVRLRGAAGKPGTKEGEVASPWIAAGALTGIGALALLFARRRRSARAAP